MSNYGQRIFGFFKRFKEGCPLAAIPLFDSLTKTANILEDIEGQDGLYIYKPTSARGKGWKIGLDTFGESSSGLFTARKPYDLIMEFDAVSGETTATLYNLFHQNDVISYEQAGTLTATLDAEAVLYIGIQFDTSNGATTFLQGTTLADVAEVAAPAGDQTTIKRGLYKLSSAVVDDVRRFSVAVDIRSQVNFNTYFDE